MKSLGQSYFVTEMYAKPLFGLSFEVVMGVGVSEVSGINSSGHEDAGIRMVLII